jgi:TRAP-type transport system periplasmic protein
MNFYRKTSLAVVITALGVTAAQAQTKWDLPSAYPATNFHSENLAQFAKDVDAASGGKLKITLHANGALFKAPEIKRAVQGNQAQMGEILLANFANENPLFALDGIPFLATSYSAAQKLYAAQKPALEKAFAAQGMMMLYAVAWPPQGIYANKEVNAAADLKGIKWRAYSPATAKIGELVGAQAVTIQAAELSQALATGVVQSYMSSGSTGVDTKTFEHLKFYHDTQAWLPKNAVLVNKSAFDALDKATQYAVLKSGKAAEDRGWKRSGEVNESSVKTLAEKGVKIVKPSTVLMGDMQKVGDVMLGDWLKVAGAEGKAVVDGYRAAK